jgi:small subunit ribosomal protein S4
MARYTGPTTRISRRFATPIFGATKAFEKRNFPPGQHGPKLRRKLSEYAVGLNEKQKLRYTYGLLERQFRRTFEIAKRERGVTGERFLQLLETRLDSVVYLLGFAKSRAAARQLVGHGHVRVNGHKLDIASAVIKAGDEIEIKGPLGHFVYHGMGRYSLGKIKAQGVATQVFLVYRWGTRCTAGLSSCSAEVY